jgi:hypothetical protein
MVVLLRRMKKRDKESYDRTPLLFVLVDTKQGNNMYSTA